MLNFVISLALHQDGDPIARHASYLAKAKSLRMEFTVKDTRAGSVGSGKSEVVRPNLERFSMKWEGESFLFVQSAKGGLAMRDDLKAYSETTAAPKFGFLPETIAGVAALGYPFFLATPTLKDLYANARVQAMGKETVRGSSCDKVSVSEPGAEANGSVFWIDSEGRLLRWVRTVYSQGRKAVTTFEFTTYEPTASTVPANYANVLPLGYVPYSIPATRTRTVQTGEKAPLGSWTNVRTGKKIDLTTVKPVALVFTDPECAICAQIEPFLAELRKQLKVKGCSLVEVSLGKTRPNTDRKDKDRPVVWDSDGAIEAKFGTPGTPFFFVVDKEGTLVRGFQGYTKDLEKTISKTLLSAFDPD